jgi:hypothetical protein
MGQDDHTLYPPYSKTAVRAPDTIIALLFITLDKVQHLRSLFYLFLWIDRPRFQYRPTHVLAACPNLAVTATLMIRKNIPPLLPKCPFFLQQTHLSSLLSRNQRMLNFFCVPA